MAGRASAALTAGEALGRSRGGLSTKIHLAADGRGRPLPVLLTGGQAGDSPQPPAGPGRHRRAGPGRPAAQAPSAAARGQGLRPRVHPRGGGPPDFDKEACKQRNVVERCFSRLRQRRDLATRYAKRAAIYCASLVLIAAIIWLQ